MSVSTVAMIQARMSSTRLPSKSREMIHGRPMLGWVIDRAREIHGLTEVVVVTSIDPTDDWVVGYSLAQNTRCLRGRLWDVLARFKDAAKELHLKSDDLIMRLTADCPGLTPSVSHEVLTLAQTATSPIAVGNTAFWPDGLDTEVFPVAFLEEAADRATSVADREHVTPWMRRHQAWLQMPLDPPRREWKWSVDTPDDLAYVRLLFDRLGPGFRWQDVIELKPEHVCVGCAEALPHVQRSLTSISGPRDYTVWDLHETRVAGGAGIEECTAAPLIEALARFGSLCGATGDPA